MKKKRKYTRKVKEVVLVLPPETIKADMGGIVTDGVPSFAPRYEVVQADIDLLPPSLKAQLKAGTEIRKRHNLPDNLKERIEAMVKRFQGDRPR